MERHSIKKFARVSLTNSSTESVQDKKKQQVYQDSVTRILPWLRGITYDEKQRQSTI